VPSREGNRGALRGRWRIELLGTGYIDQVRWALDPHVSLINNKSRQVPTAWRALVDEYLTHPGYRFTVRVRGVGQVAASDEAGEPRATGRR
jgi:hypothetical protein